VGRVSRNDRKARKAIPRSSACDFHGEIGQCLPITVGGRCAVGALRLERCSKAPNGLRLLPVGALEHSLWHGLPAVCFCSLQFTARAA
jgi:hypothetical protein